MVNMSDKDLQVMIVEDEHVTEPLRQGSVGRQYIPAPGIQR